MLFHRRAFLASLAAAPFLRWFVPSQPQTQRRKNALTVMDLEVGESYRFRWRNDPSYQPLIEKGVVVGREVDLHYGAIGVDVRLNNGRIVKLYGNEAFLITT